MSLHLPSRRVLGTTPTILKTLRPTLITPALTLLHAHQTRPASSVGNSRIYPKGKKVTGSNKPKDLQDGVDQAAKREQLENAIRERMTQTMMQSPSVFSSDIENIPANEPDGRGRLVPKKTALPGRTTAMGASSAPEHMRLALDPDPKSRRLWERKMVIRQVTRALDVRGKETRAERLKRTEREVLSKSPWLATSTKKLMHLARQVSGKTVEDALTQMKFSKKKFAKEVMYELNLARDKAIVERGMGLGKVNGEYDPEETKVKRIRDVRHSKWVNIDDPTKLYIHEAWVNKGPWRGKKPNYRARGRTDLIKMPQASITIRLKEDKSRLREDAERKAKEYKKGPWIPLPNRPVTAQRPFYCW